MKLAPMTTARRAFAAAAMMDRLSASFLVALAARVVRKVAAAEVELDRSRAGREEQLVVTLCAAVGEEDLPVFRIERRHTRF